ncbi:MAG: hypothetical protein AAFN92_04885, partial [Bacteroidota bacterium]
MNVVAQDDMVFPVLKMAEVAIDSASYINIVSTPETFKPTAVLYGYAAIKAKRNSESPDGDDSNEAQEKLSFEAARLSFSGMRLSTVSPKFSMLPNNQSFVRFEYDPALLNFPLSITEAELRPVGADRMRLSVVARLNLMSQDDNGFAAEAGLSIEARLEDVDGRDKWKFDNFQINSIYAELKLPQLEIIGYAHVFDDDVVYGKGF